jgi:hypothetical protein
MCLEAPHVIRTKYVFRRGDGPVSRRLAAGSRAAVETGRIWTLAQLGHRKPLAPAQRRHLRGGCQLDPLRPGPDRHGAAARCGRQSASPSRSSAGRCSLTHPQSAARTGGRSRPRPAPDWRISPKGIFEPPAHLPTLPSSRQEHSNVHQNLESHASSNILIVQRVLKHQFLRKP